MHACRSTLEDPTEKAAAALLAGMPVVSKPATATALVAHRMVEKFVADKLLPEGALSFVCGGAGNMLEHLGGQDVLAFTGSSLTARKLRSLAAVIERSVHVNVEADSLNAAVLGPGVGAGDETGGLFLADVARDMTQKTGQKCTAIRRVLVPVDSLDWVCEALRERLAAVVVGNPADEKVRMGPLATANQLRDVREGCARLVAETDGVFGESGEVKPHGGSAGKGFFFAPVLRRAAGPNAAPVVHQHEVFGPVATVIPYSGRAEEAAEIVARGEGGLVASVYSDDREFVRGAVLAMSPYNGRLYLGSEKIAAQSPGPGTVLPTLLHGGPGRAGGGEELGGLRGMQLYLQRTALQGDKSVIGAIIG